MLPRASRMATASSKLRSSSHVRLFVPLALPRTLTPLPSRCYASVSKKSKITETAIPYTGSLLSASSTTFTQRHVGPDDTELCDMLNQLSPPAESLDQFIQQVVPSSILNTDRSLVTTDPNSTKPPSVSRELDVSREAHNHARKNRLKACFIGAGYYPCTTPAPIVRDVLQNPSWYTSYTPYQPEISQGRLESLLNFQTMIADLTGLPIANASLLDEGTAASEAMAMSLNILPASRAKRPGRTYVISDALHPQTLAVLRGLAEGLGVRVLPLDLQDPSSLSTIEELGDDFIGAMVQYPDTLGRIHAYRELADLTHQKGALLSAATDLLALTVLTPPGEWGADIAFGSAQRFGIPLGFGGPHAAFFSVQDKYKRKMPGRLIGVSQDRLGRRALRLSLQTREQHIRREKATSNVCTAQALLANMSAFYAIYHGPEGLKKQAEAATALAHLVYRVASFYGHNPISYGADKESPLLFDTIVLDVGERAAAGLIKAAHERGVNLRNVGNGRVGISVHEDLTPRVYDRLFASLQDTATQNGSESFVPLAEKFHASKLTSFTEALPESVRRSSPYLTHQVFNSHHSEAELVRYIHHLASKDLSLVHSMIPLGSCTMKLNGATEMSLITLRGFSELHPYAPSPDTLGYQKLILSLEEQLKAITSMDGVSLQPNSGAQGEFAGLRAIRKYHESQPGSKRDICLIPVSAHGTNPASAAKAGMRVVPVTCDSKTGNLDVQDLEEKCRKHKDELAAIMVTYPSTYGVFEPEIRWVCEIVHEYGGLVYMDGANMNAQIGLCSPGEIGADVCHLNLHKTFCIPHGGGGPGVGPICVKEKLVPYLPGLSPDAAQPMVSSAPYGSASILPITWSYNKLMGTNGLRRATTASLLNANYLLAKLQPHFKILFTNEFGRCAHEFILDTRPFHDTAGVEAIDIAKRLQDYGFHAPTMSWPVPNTLMIEPTESESKAELDRFVDALIAIRHEIRAIEDGDQPREGNLLKMAPHPQADLVDGDDGQGSWSRPYPRAQAAYPLPWLREKKFWPSVARVDDTYGDMNLFCTCPPVEDTTSE